MLGWFNIFFNPWCTKICPSELFICDCFSLQFCIWYTMTRDSPMAVDISSDDSCSAGDDDGDRSNKRPRHNGAIDKPFRELTFEGIFCIISSNSSKDLFSWVSLYSDWFSFGLIKFCAYLDSRLPDYHITLYYHSFHNWIQNNDYGIVPLYGNFFLVFDYDEDLMSCLNINYWPLISISGINN